MEKTFRPWDPDQCWLLPPSVKELVPEGDLAHFIRDTVVSLDLSFIEETYEEERGRTPRGRPPVVSEGDEAKPPAKAQRNFTDPDSRIMKGAEKFIQAYNGQVAVDAQSQVIVAQAVTQDAVDKQQLIPMVQQVKENTGKHAHELSADAGYCSEDNLKELGRRHIRGYVATGKEKHTDPRSVGARTGAAGSFTERMAQRLRLAGRRSRYRLRKQVVEPVFGQIKQARGFRQFLLRGLGAVSAEWALICTAHNLLKVYAVATAE